ncbi:unnamed protein product [Rotaria magnacalcarata]|uniref:P2X purinoceptor n=2 Tax=Rotaria magnacalcarata TaxID=392030 RepID=A0A816BPH1_9BILA|nr:unnamed protein product [Rotaria magnacalcarata]CAF1612097.1 unnamed protein product [Rotaria magnacalcarata]CAF2156078.1 unnamed protein product [Rotaria magnacalcarata]CAF3774733.1 unnamed protein product [Rotaria magnacalcarata]CAF4031715.1 unnamed protein product [Rotaria magnacalcarata]
MPSRSGRCCKFSLFFKELFYGFVTEYETPKIVSIHTYAMTTLLRIMQIVLLLYSIFYLFLNEKGYQKQDSSIISSVTLKVKGIGYSYTPKNESFAFDGSDYIVPPSENNAIFIMTNFIQTDQVRSKCGESPTVSEAICIKHSDCQNKPYNPNINGRWTGRCIMRSNVNQFNEVNTTKNQTTGLCELQGWCPVENDRAEATFINEVVNFTIFIKNFIEFPAFHVKHKNMVENLKPCIFHPVEEKDCPIFRLDYILREAEKNDSERELMLHLGGVIRVKIDWNCDLDRSIKLCKPIYSFARLDTKFHEESFSVGFNFRFASNWKYSKRYLRALTKAYGLRLIICVSGKAGKFDFITLTLNIGSIIGIFGMATFFCDIILLNLTKKSSVYRDFVYQRVNIDASRSNSVSQRIQNRDENVGALFENPLTNPEKFSLPIWTSETFVSFADDKYTTSTYDFITPPDSSKIQPSLGLTNILK